jgi:hypothetical protein
VSLPREKLASKVSLAQSFEIQIPFIVSPSTQIRCKKKSPDENQNSQKKMMNRFGFGASSPRLTDDEGWSSDESSGTSISPSFQETSALDITAQSPKKGKNHTEDDENSEAYFIKRRKQDYLSLPLVPYIDDDNNNNNDNKIAQKQSHIPASSTQQQQQHYRPANDHHHHHHVSKPPPLIEFIQNEWHAISKDPGFYSSSHGGDVPHLVQVLSAPKFRRWGLVGFVLICLFWMVWKLWAQEQWYEHVLFRDAVSYQESGLEAGRGVGLFGVNMRPEFMDIIHLKDLSRDLVWQRGNNKSRILVVGDVHGCVDECKFSFVYYLLLLVDV